MKRAQVAGRLMQTALAMLALAFSALTTSLCDAAQQTITLKPGWNSVFLEVDPEPNSPEEVFAGLPVLSAWTWNADVSTQEYILDPTQLIPNQPNWSSWFPASRAESFLTNLFAIYGGRAYLIQLDGQQNVQWSVSGLPAIPNLKWKDNSFNFVGFHLQAGSEPFFESFFASSKGLDNKKIYILNDSGQWELVASPSMTRMRRGEGFWIYCSGHSEFQGPLAVSLDQNSGLQYGTSMVEQEMRVKNDSPAAAQVTVANDGDVTLKYFKYDPAQQQAAWESLPASMTIAAGEEKKLRLAVIRAGLPGGVVKTSSVEVRNDAGMKILVPVSAAATDKTGLWLGVASIRQVSELTKTGEPFDLKPTASEFALRLILHRSTGGQVKILREVVQMWQNGTTKEDPENPGKYIVDQPGKFVLVTNDSKIKDYQGAGLRDGQPVGRRITSAAFGFSQPVSMQGALAAGSTLTCSIPLAADDARNPFRHLYHRHHDQAEESYQVTRDIELEFTTSHPDNIEDISWGDSNLGGIYQETITFEGRKSVRAKGIFLLQKMADIGELVQ